MKSKTSFCNRTILRTDVTRFAPVWILYTLGFLMIQMMALGKCFNDYEKACYMRDLVSVIIAVNGLYALVVSQTLFGDLLNTRMCNTLHAMPLTRDDFFRTHMFAGLCFSVIPNVLVMLVSLPMLGKAASTVMYVLATGIGSYIFYFGAALLSIQLAGNRIAAVLIYGILNFWALLPMWFIKYLYEPMMYGVDLPVREVFVRFCPTVSMLEGQYLFVRGTDVREYPYIPELMYIKRVGPWGYVGLWTVVGLVALAASQVLYRKRRLETAGDLVAYKSTKPVFLVLFTIMVAGFAHVAAYTLDFRTGVASLLFVAVGLTVGWFAGLMLMDRQLFVFRWKRMVPLAAMLAVLAISVGLTVGDAFDIVNKVPEPEDVEQVRVYIAGWNDHGAKVRNPERIRELTELHRNELQAYNGRGLRNKLSGNRNFTERVSRDGWYSVTMEYTLRSGKTLKRTYDMDISAPETEIVRTCMNQSDAIFRVDFDTVSELLSKIERLQVFNAEGIRGEIIVEGAEREELINAILADAAEGHMAAGWWFHMYEEEVSGLRILYNIPDESYRDYPYYSYYGNELPSLSVSHNIYRSMEHVVGWMLEHEYITQEYLDLCAQREAEREALRQ